MIIRFIADFVGFGQHPEEGSNRGRKEKKLNAFYYQFMELR